MGLSHKSTGSAVLDSELTISKQSPEDRVIALAGNPNVGKSTVFNGLTGMNQHTGNWPGKTVTNAQGSYLHHGKRFILVDIPGTYSLMAHSAEEEVARDFICFGAPDATVIVTDATCLERNLNLVLQIMEATDKVVVCVNLLDEAKKKKIHVDLARLSKELGVPVAGTSAIAKNGLEDLMEQVEQVTFGEVIPRPQTVHYDDVIEEAIGQLVPLLQPLVSGRLKPRWLALKLLDLDDSLHQALNQYLGFDILSKPGIVDILEQVRQKLQEQSISEEFIRDQIVTAIVAQGETIYQKCVTLGNQSYAARDRKIDKLLTSKATGIPFMLLLLGVIFWLTITGANYPSELLSTALFWLEEQLSSLFLNLGMPLWLHNMLVLGMFRTLAWVISVMLPPMAIFFPLFTLLEDSGYLPRIAFNMDKFFRKACAHGKQCLTMCMGFGCNACGVIGCRIIDSPRERLIAILTNNFVPCNGRFAPPL